MAEAPRCVTDILMRENKTPLLEHEEDSEDERQHEEEVDEYNRGAPRLPWGVAKRVLREAAPSLWDEGRPTSGDKVAVHFVAKLQDGTQVGSSRDKGEPFRFVVDKRPREVVMAMELAVITMRRTEIAEFKVAPRFAYDDLGSPPLIPPNASMIFEVELIEWATQADLFEDGCAIKTVERAGVGAVGGGGGGGAEGAEAGGGRRPQRGQEVVVSLRCCDRKGEVIEEHSHLEHVVGDPIFGPLSRVVVTALLSMAEGEKSTVALTRDAIPSDRRFNRSTLEIELERIFEARDISVAQDRSLVKKLLRHGGAAAAAEPQEDAASRARAEAAASLAPKVNESARVKLRVESATDGAEPLYGFAGPKTLSFEAGGGEVCDALELAALEMLPGERAALTCRPAAELCAEPELGLAALQAPSAVLVVELLSAEGGEPSCEGRAPEERLAWAKRRKEAAAGLYRRQRHTLALRSYTKIAKLLGELESADAEGVVGEARELRLLCELNRAACFLKLADFSGARASCDEALRSDPDNVKALFRRASAHFGLSDFAAATQDLGRVLALEPRNADARGLAAKLREAQRSYAEAAKATAARMIAAGSGGGQDASAEDATAAKGAAEASPPQRKAAVAIAEFLAPSACLPLEPCLRMLGLRRLASTKEQLQPQQS